jgi:hypothetical protein
MNSVKINPGTPHRVAVTGMAGDHTPDRTQLNNKRR